MNIFQKYVTFLFAIFIIPCILVVLIGSIAGIFNPEYSDNTFDIIEFKLIKKWGFFIIIGFFMSMIPASCIYQPPHAGDNEIPV